MAEFNKEESENIWIIIVRLLLYEDLKVYKLHFGTLLNYVNLRKGGKEAISVEIKCECKS